MAHHIRGANNEDEMGRRTHDVRDALELVIRRSRELLADAVPQNCDGSRPCAVERFQVYPGEARGGEQASPVAEQDRQDVHQDLVYESPPQALTGYVGAEDFEGLAACGAERGGDGFPDITGEERDRRVRRVRRLMGKDELSSPVVG